MNQAFFTLSLGIGAMAIFGSYIGARARPAGRERPRRGAGIPSSPSPPVIIFLACFTLRCGPDQRPQPHLHHPAQHLRQYGDGPSVGQPVLPVHGLGGTSTVLAKVFENIICCGMELTGWNRQKSSLVNFLSIIALLSALCAGLQRLAWDGFRHLRRCGAGCGGFPSSATSSRRWAPRLPAVLRHPPRLGLGQLQERKSTPAKAPKMHDWMRGYLTYGPPHRPVHLRVRPVR